MERVHLADNSRIEQFSERYLTHVKGELAGQPLLFAEWQRQLLRAVFNQTQDDGARQIRTFYLSVPRKAGKSTLAAAIALYMLVSDGERGAEIYSAAKAAKQARPAKRGITKLPQLDQVSPTKKSRRRQ